MNARLFRLRTLARPRPPVPWGGRVGAIATVVVGLCTGCSTTPPPVAPPPARVEADRLATQASRLQAEGNWKAAAVVWKRAGDRYALLNQTADLALAWHNEGTARRALGDWETARALLERAATANAQGGRTQVWWRNQLALIQGEREHDPAAARTRVNRLDQAPGTPTEPRLAALWDHEVAALELLEGHAESALVRVQRAQAVYHTLADQPGAAASLTLGAQILLRLGRPSEAESRAVQALGLFESLADPPGIAVALATAGFAAAAQPGREDEARNFLARAESNFAAMGRDAERSAVARALAGLRSPSPAAQR